MDAMTPLFRKFVDNYTVGELPKNVQVDTSIEKRRELGYVQLESGEWAHISECALLPKNGKLSWVRMG